MAKINNQTVCISHLSFFSGGGRKCYWETLKGRVLDFKSLAGKNGEEG